MQNTTYFDTIGGEGPAYWLGFFAADSGSYANGRQIRVQLARADRDQVQAIADLFGTHVRDREAKPDKRTGKRYANSYTLLNSKHLWDSIRRLGLPPRTRDLTGSILANIPSNLLHHFVRGYFDGDGHVGLVKNSPRLNLCGTLPFLGTLEATVRPLLGLRRSEIVNKGTFARLTWTGITQVRRLGDWLYTDATICLARKRATFDSVPTHRGTSRFRGVYLNSRGKWISRLFHEGKTRHIGSFSDEVEAALAYDQKVRAAYGDSAIVNFRPGGLFPT